MTLFVLDYGAIIQKLSVRNKNGGETNVVVGFENPRDYISDTFFLGACIGRYAGRISGGGFSLKGKTFTLPTEKGLHLHGGKEGFGKKYWSIEEVDHSEQPYVRLSYLSDDMEEGYPGALHATVTYKIVDKALHIVHKASTDRTTILNMVNHSYFRLDRSEKLDHYHLLLNCSKFLETDDSLLPTGNIISVKNRSLDFTEGKNIGKIRMDTPFVVSENGGQIARVYSEKSGIAMKVNSNQPAIVVYTPPHLAAICFETQNYPDAPNNPNFPSSILEPGETYDNTSVFEFDLVL